MFITLLSILGILLSLVILIVSAYVAGRVNAEGADFFILNSYQTHLAYVAAVVAAVFGGVILAIFVVHIILDAMRDRKGNTNRSNVMTEASNLN